MGSVNVAHLLRSKRCILILTILIMGLTASATVAANTGTNSESDWRKLSLVNEPPNKPSISAAKAATQHLTKSQIQARLKQMTTLYRASSAHANGTALQILKREIQLLQLAGAE